MFASTLQILGVIFQSAWTLLTSFYIPGTNVTPAGLFIFIASAVIGLHFVKRLFAAMGGGSNADKE